MKKLSSILALLWLLLTPSDLVEAQESPNQIPALPVFELLIKPQDLSTTVFEIQGSVQLPQQADAFQLYLQQGQDYSFSCPVQDGRLPVGLKSFSFQGTSHVQHPRCRATGQEIYNLTRVAPYPEIVGPGAFYQAKFQLPEGIGALTSDGDVSQSQGLVFQIAKFAAPRRIQRGSVEFEFTLPSDFEPGQEYLDWILTATERLERSLGKYPYPRLKIGAITRGDGKELAGTPSGNLVLYSRSVLGGAFDPSSLGPIGFGEELVEPLRLLVIAHEISHFWFGLRYRGQDGWMVEGIPQYLAWRLVAEEYPVYEPILAQYMEKMAALGQGDVADVKLGDSSAAHLAAYFQGPSLLYKLGDQIGHDQLISFLASVYESNANPSFAQVERAFKSRFPEHAQFWDRELNWRQPTAPPAKRI